MVVGVRPTASPLTRTAAAVGLEETTTESMLAESTEDLQPARATQKARRETWIRMGRGLGSVNCVQNDIGFNP